MRLAVVLVGLLAGASPAFAQEGIRLFAAKTFSEFPFLADPHGVGLAWTGRVGFGFSLEAAFAVSRRSTDYLEFLCDVYWPVYSNCQDESATRNTQLRELTLGVVAEPRIADRVWLRLKAGAGAAWTQGSSRGLISNRELPEVGNASGIGPMAGIGLGYRFRPDSRWVIVFDYQFHSADFSSGCATDSYTPVCGSLKDHTLQLGLGYDLSRRAPAAER